jgi:hypothetical protein
MNKVPNNAGQNPKRTRRIYACPDQLAHLIHFLNLLPPDVNAPFHEALNLSKQATSEGKAHLKEFQQQFRALSAEFQTEMLERAADKKRDFDKWRRVNAWCFRFNDWRDTCRGITRELVRSSLDGEIPFIGYNIKFSDVLSLDEQGFFRRAKRELVDALTDIEAARFRECSICQRFFWADRKDKRLCSRRCSDTSQKRRQRQLQQERGRQYQEARKKNRTRKEGNIR